MTNSQTGCINCCLLNFSSASNFKILQCCLKLVKMLSECQTAWIVMRRWVTQRLIQIQAVCIWRFGCFGRLRIKSVKGIFCKKVYRAMVLGQVVVIVKTNDMMCISIYKMPSSLTNTMFDHIKHRICLRNYIFIKHRICLRNYIFTDFEQHWITLKIKVDRKFRRHFIWRAKS